MITCTMYCVWFVLSWVVWGNVRKEGMMLEKDRQKINRNDNQVVGGCTYMSQEGITKVFPQKGTEKIESSSGAH